MADENKNTDGVPLSRIKTYEDAVKEALQTQSMSSASMLIAEQKKRENFKKEDEAQSVKNPRNLLLLILSIVFIVGALGLLAFSIISNNNKQPANDPKSILKSKYFEAEQIIEVPAAQLSRNTLSKIQQALNEPYKNGEIAQIIITKEIKADPTSIFDIKKKVPYETLDLLALIEARAPENLRRSLDKEFMLGTHKSSKNEPFLVIKTTNFENVFAGMFEWELTLAKDMANIFAREIEAAKNITPKIPDIEMSTATSTEGTTTPEIKIPQRTVDNTRVWHDKVINNSDARALLGNNGEILFFYTFIDNEYLFFGTKEETFNEVRRRIRSAKLVL